MSTKHLVTFLDNANEERVAADMELKDVPRLGDRVRITFEAKTGMDVITGVVVHVERVYHIALGCHQVASVEVVRVRLDHYKINHLTRAMARQP